MVGDWTHLSLSRALPGTFTTSYRHLCRQMESLLAAMELNNPRLRKLIEESTIRKVHRLFLEEFFFLGLLPIDLFQDRSKPKVLGNFMILLSEVLLEVRLFFHSWSSGRKCHLDSSILTVQKAQFFAKETLRFVPNWHIFDTLSFKLNHIGSHIFFNFKQSFLINFSVIFNFKQFFLRPNLWQNNFLNKTINTWLTKFNKLLGFYFCLTFWSSLKTYLVVCCKSMLLSPSQVTLTSWSKYILPSRL